MLAKITTLLAALALAAPCLAALPKKKPAPRPAAARAAVARPAPAVAAPLPDTPEIARLRRAYAFALPVYAMMRTRAAQLARAETPDVNRLYARTTLADAGARDASSPTNDTLDASAWLDLAGGPVILDAPALPDRYHSAALVDLLTDTVAIVGTRGGGRGGRYLIAGPGWNGTVPPRTTLLRSTTNDAWLLVRLRVDGPADLAAATGLLRAFTLDVPKDNAAPVPVTAVPVARPDAATLLAVVDEALGRGPLPAAAAARLAGLADLGLAPGRTDALAALAPDAQALWTKSISALRREIAGDIASTGETVDGWRYPAPGIGGFGDDDPARARVALDSLGALPRTEAIVLAAAVDAAGAPLDGGKAYTVRIPANLPVGAFWSLTMYRQEPDGRLFFIDTPSKRYSVGDRTPELRAERDGSYDIFVQAGRPSGERVVNWLPAPAGRFRLIFRAWLPKPEFLDGSFRLPPVATSDVIP